MIEDALKATRTLHRLIMTVSLVTIVFALSINLPEDKAAQKQIVDGVISTDFAAYSAFVDAKVEEKRKAVLDPLSDKFEKDLEEKGHLTFRLSALADEFRNPIHIGRLLLNELNLTEVANTSIDNLNALNGLSLGANVQILVPRMEALLKEVDIFLGEHPQAGQRVDTIRISLSDIDFTAESFLPSKQATVGIYFELLGPVRTAGAPTFSANFLADIVEVEKSSFLTWLRNQSIDEELVSVSENEVMFAPSLNSAPNGFTNEKLGVLSLKLADEISKSSPASQSVSILGTNIPGALAIFASPIVLLALSYYFGAHTGHLSRIVSKDRDSFEEFSWLPISLKAERCVRFANKWSFNFSSGVIECFSSAMLLPVLSMGLLYFRLQAFDNLSNLQMYCLATAAFGVILFGTMALQNVMLVRQFINKPAD